MNSRAPSRRNAVHGTERRDSMVVLFAGVALVATLVLVAVGLYLTRFRPPREAAVRIEGETITAGQVERRLLHLLLYDTGSLGADQTQFTSKALDRLEREELIRRRAPALVGELTDEALQQHLRTSLTPPQPPAPSISGAPGVSVATPTATAMSDEAFAKALQDRLVAARMSREELETIARADALEAKLKEHFRAELPKGGQQYHLVVARLTDKEKADQVRAIGLRPGVEFVRVANANSVGGGGPPGDLGWVLPAELKPEVVTVLQTLAPGAISEVKQNGLYYEVYQVVEAASDREYDSDQMDTLVEEKLKAWVEAERGKLSIERVLSASTDEWIRTQALGAYREQTRQQASG